MVYDGRVVDATPVGWSEQDALSGDVTVASTTNAALTGISITVTTTSTNDVYVIDLDPDVLINTGPVNNNTELLVDGVQTGATLWTGGPAAMNNARIAGHKRYRITGLAAGSHTFTARTRNTASSTSVTLKSGNTTMTLVRVS